jgi:hypothetical protein
MTQLSALGGPHSVTAAADGLEPHLLAALQGKTELELSRS